MAFVNEYEDIAKLENQDFINSLPDFEYGTGKIPPLTAYRKLSVESFNEAMTLAKIGAVMGDKVVPGQKLYFTQALLMGAITSKNPKYRSIMMICPTRYGKSYLTGLAGIGSAAVLNREVRIGGATRDKADIVMEKIINFMPNTSLEIQNGMVIGDTDANVNKKIARLSTQTSREALSWKTGGSIKMFTMSETSKNRDVAGAGAIGIGGDMQIYDETELISNSNYYTARRFLIESSETKLVELGNPLTLGHFKDVYDDDSTFVVHINDVTAILEGRMSRKDFELTLIPKHTQEYKSFIQCEFPPPDAGDGFFSTMPKSFLDLPEGRVCTQRIGFMGIDSAYKGADGLVVTVASLCRDADGNAWVELEYQEDLKARHPRWGPDTTMQIALDILTLAHKHNVVSTCIDIAFGVHVFEMIRQIEPDFRIEPVNFGNKPTESRKEIFYAATWAYNLRAEMHLDVKELCENNFLFIDTKYFDQLIREMREIRVENELGKIKIENKSKIKARLGASPDYLDSLCLAVRAMVMSGLMGGTLDDEEIAYIEG